MGSRLPMILGLFLSALIGVWAWGAAGRWLSSASPPTAPPGLQIVYPPDGHRTPSNRIFLIGTAPVAQPVTVNGQRIQRSPSGHFAPSFPLAVGPNRFQIQAGPERLELEVRREQPPVQAEPLRPAGRVARRVHEPLCYAAVAPPQTRVELSLGNRRVSLQPDAAQTLPANSAVLTDQTQPQRPAEQVYRGCLSVDQPGNLGRARITLKPAGRVIEGQGDVEILPASPGWVAVLTEVGITRTGPSTDHSRLTPLPVGVEAQVTGWEGDWVRLDYGAWVLGTQVRLETRPAPPRSVIRGVVGQVGEGWTDLRLPLERRVPYQVDQGEGTFTLTLENTTAQTDTIRLDDGPLVQRLDWSQPKPGQVRYSLRLKTPHPWGYRLRYEDTTLVLSLRHPPQFQNPRRPLTGHTILLDPGHGGP
ncbi:MAG: N-acetylmuramoyl-L-alanine amidase, partial [Gloeomargaritaceae cyanobacterium C42_A2020_066]|nr:N-acetylmuramoyl-L-alanine amidase [Gloeomargaritaceae cyanobacterium C42_A2020_066]